MRLRLYGLSGSSARGMADPVATPEAKAVGLRLTKPTKGAKNLGGLSGKGMARGSRRLYACASSLPRDTLVPPRTRTREGCGWSEAPLSPFSGLRRFQPAPFSGGLCSATGSTGHSSGLLLRGLLAGLLLLALTGCGEMYRQPSFQAQESPRLAAPPSAVPVTGVEPRYVGVEGKALANPIPREEASVNRGRALYETNCAACHGRQGKGDGPVASAYVPQPADLTGPRVQNLTDGDLFLRITNGFSTMPAFRKQIPPDDRWHVVNYMRTLGGRR